ncbi:mannose-6-phosphate receptor binding domain-containing protein [Calycina marina]|uniref:Mannose-6-phosphate receptor binding domain-containing protein n=1 Tax=Calycina marina TaxID=1763456 RepID=A0A9P8CG63_9HELO|nr:mannose-6-phosphate receptor binding domain-containing protein [Calycina marina]
MYFPLLPSVLLLVIGVSSSVQAASDDTLKPIDPCTVGSTTGSFYDLRSLSITPPAGDKKPGKNDKMDSWHARGWDYKSNFTLNICAPVIETLDDIVGIDKEHRANVSAFYKYRSETYSLGQMSSNLTLRGRRIVLQYSNGSPCGKDETKRMVRKDNSTWDDDSPDISPRAYIEGSRRKSAIISFHCDKDPLATTALATFVGVDPDECAYSFEVLSTAACVAAQPAQQGVGPAAVFAIIGVIAILVYFLGGVFYQRNVAHARGWRQLPNYSMWAGIGSFIKASGNTLFRRSRRRALALTLH